MTMRIEFSLISDGTNVQVLLIEDLGGYEISVDRIYTADHRGGIHFGEDQGQPVSARQLFEWVEDSWKPPVIGGRLAYLHPYWQEREEAKARRTARAARAARLTTQTGDSQ